MREDRLVIAAQASSARSAAQIATAMTLGEDDLALRAVRGQRGQFEAVRREDGTVTARVSTKRERGQIIAEVCPARQGNRRIITRCYENADMETLTARLALTPKAMHAFAEQIPALADESLRRNEIVRAEPVREWCEGTGWLPDDYTERTCAVLANTAQCEDGCMNVSAAVCEAIRCAPYRSSDTAALVDILLEFTKPVCKCFHLFSQKSLTGYERTHIL